MSDAAQADLEKRAAAEKRAEYDKQVAARREATAKAETEMGTAVPIPTQEEADLARLGLIGPEGFTPPPEPKEAATPARHTAPAAPAAPPRPHSTSSSG